jgi:hypothetical protein
MATKAKAGRGSKFQRGDGGGTEVFTTIAEILNISGPTSTVNMLDATSMDSTAGEIVPEGIVRNGEVTLTMHLIDSDAQQQGLFTDQAAFTKRNFKIVANNHAVEGSKSTRSFSGYVQSIGDEFPFDGKMARNVTIAIDGAVTRTYAPA